MHPFIFTVYYYHDSKNYHNVITTSITTSLSQPLSQPDLLSQPGRYHNLI